MSHLLFCCFISRQQHRYDFVGSRHNLPMERLQCLSGCCMKVLYFLSSLLCLRCAMPGPYGYAHDVDRQVLLRCDEL